MFVVSLKKTAVVTIRLFFVSCRRSPVVWCLLFASFFFSFFLFPFFNVIVVSTSLDSRQLSWFGTFIDSIKHPGYFVVHI